MKYGWMKLNLNRQIIGDLAMSTLLCNSSYARDCRLLRILDVVNMTGVPRSTIYLKMKRKEFPQQVNIGARSVAWVESEILDWIKSNLEKREN